MSIFGFRKDKKDEKDETVERPIKDLGNGETRSGTQGVTNLEECKRIVADLEKQGMDMSSYKRILSTPDLAADQEVIDALLGRLKKTVFLQ